MHFSIVGLFSVLLLLCTVGKIRGKINAGSINMATLTGSRYTLSVSAASNRPDTVPLGVMCVSLQLDLEYPSTVPIPPALAQAHDLPDAMHITPGSDNAQDSARSHSTAAADNDKEEDKKKKKSGSKNSSATTLDHDSSSRQVQNSKTESIDLTTQQFYELLMMLEEAKASLDSAAENA